MIFYPLTLLVIPVEPQLFPIDVPMFSSSPKKRTNQGEVLCPPIAHAQAGLDRSQGALHMTSTARKLQTFCPKNWRCPFYG